MTFLVIWDAARLAGMESLNGALRAASQDDRLRRPAYLLIRSETTAARSVAVTGPDGEATVPVAPAVRAATIKHPLGHAPADTIIGPVEGNVTYLPSAGGLRVLAFDQPGGTPGPASAGRAVGRAIGAAMRDDFTGKDHDNATT